MTLIAEIKTQLEDAMRRFMSDRTRNRYNPQSKRLEISKIFDWYGKDFEKGLARLKAAAEAP